MASPAPTPLAQIAAPRSAHRCSTVSTCHAAGARRGRSAHCVGIARERRDTSVALTSTLHRFETHVLTEERNYQGLARLNAGLIQHATTRSPNWRVTLDIDSSESPVHGAQEQSAYNGHFESVCYHPLFVFNQHGDCLAAKLRPGNVHSAAGWDEVLLPILDGYRAQGHPVVVRADAAFATPAVYDQ